MNSILLAIQFLTIIPVNVRNISLRQYSFASGFFPVVGLLIGFILAGVNNLLCKAGLDAYAASAIVVTLLAFITGGLHLDGLSDAADGFFSGKTDKSEILRVMRDPHAGAMGVIAIVLALILKIVFLASVGPSARPMAIILVCILSRWSMECLLTFMPYARPDGKAKKFIDGSDRKIFFVSTAFVLAISCLSGGASGVYLFFVTAAIALAAGAYFKKKIGGVTGDLIGAENEFVEVVLLFLIAVSGKLLH